MVGSEPPVDILHVTAPQDSGMRNVHGYSYCPPVGNWLMRESPDKRGAAIPIILDWSSNIVIGEIDKSEPRLQNRRFLPIFLWR